MRESLGKRRPRSSGGASFPFDNTSCGLGGGFGGRAGTSGPWPSPQNNLIFLATVHGDPAGYERVWRWLDFFRPEVISVEISPFSVRYRERAHQRWQRLLEEALRALPPGAAEHLAVARVAAQVALPFEYRAARDWSRAHGIPLRLLDQGALARRHLPRYARELLNPQNVRALWEHGTGGSLEEFVAGEFRRAHMARRGQARRWPGQPPPEDARREQLWARRLRRLAREGRRVVHIGGWEHLVPWAESHGLPHLLADLEPAIILADEPVSSGKSAGVGPGVKTTRVPAAPHLRKEIIGEWKPAP